MLYKCPNGHDSTDSEYCSECGKRIGAPSIHDAGGAPKDIGAAVQSSREETCPVCSTPRDGDLQYCEVCRYDFLARAPFNAVAPAPKPIAATQVDAAQVTSPVAALPTETPGPVAFERLLVATNVDAGTGSSQASNIPPAQSERVYHLDLEENVVGRGSLSLGIHPEILIADESVSKRHLKFLRNADGSYSALELGSLNGTLLNGEPMADGVLTPIKPGDEFVIGSGYRLTIRSR